MTDADSYAPDPATDLLAHADFLRAVARRLVREEAEADDVAQDVWLRSLRTPPRDADEPRGWLAKVARNVVRDRARSSSARARREQRVAREARASTGEDVDHRLEVADRLARALAALPAEQRRVLYLRYYEDRTPEEIARLEGCPTATVKTRLRRGLARLREDLRERTSELGPWPAMLLPLCAVGGADRAGVGLALGVLTMKKALVAAVVLVCAVGAYVVSDPPSPEAAPPPLESRDVAAAPRSTPVEVPSGAPALAPPAAASRTAPDTPVASTRVAAAGPSSVVRGRVTYTSTGQGVPYYTFSVEGGGECEEVVTDEDGRYETAMSFPAEVRVSYRHSPVTTGEGRLDGSLRTVRIDTEPSIPLGPITPTSEDSEDTRGGRVTHRFDSIRFSPSESDAALEVTRSGAAHAVDFAVDVGPTFFLDFDAPPGLEVEDFVAHYAEEGDALETDRRRTADVHAEPRPWVRFGNEEVLSSAEPAWNLALQSREMRWCGSSDVPFTRGVCPHPIRVTLQPFAVVDGRVVDDAGDAVPNVMVGLQLEGTNRTRSARSNMYGRFTFTRVDAGRHVMFVKHKDYFPFDEVVSARLDEDVEAVLRLQRRPPGGDVRGRITSATGAYRGRVVMFLEGTGDQDAWRRADPEWSLEDGRWVADYAFEDLGSGSYRLRCCTIDTAAVADGERIVSPPDDAVHFVIGDDAPRRTLRISAVDAATGEPIDEYRVFFHPRGGVELLDEAEDEGGWSREVFDGTRFDWRVHAAGYRAAAGTQATFAGETQVVVRLERGFSAVVNLLSIESLSGLEGVEVFADGASVGWTASTGHLYLDLPARPDRVHVDERLWTVFGDGTFVSDLGSGGELGDWDEAGVFLSAYLRPVR